MPSTSIVRAIWSAQTLVLPVCFAMFDFAVIPLWGLPTCLAMFDFADITASFFVCLSPQNEVLISDEAFTTT
jgi:hypothetical protein